MKDEQIEKALKDIEIYDKIRKDTAKEILQRFKDEVMDYKEYNDMLHYYDLPTIAEKIEYFAKQYGVEVD